MAVCFCISRTPVGKCEVEAGKFLVQLMERVAIEEAMRRHEGNLSRVAASLGITRQALYRKLEKMKHSAKD